MNVPVSLAGQVIKCTRAPKLFTRPLHQLRTSIRDSRGKRGKGGDDDVTRPRGARQGRMGLNDGVSCGGPQLWPEEETSSASAGHFTSRPWWPRENAVNTMRECVCVWVCVYLTIQAYVTTVHNDWWLLRGNRKCWKRNNGEADLTRKRGPYSALYTKTEYRWVMTCHNKVLFCHKLWQQLQYSMLQNINLTRTTDCRTHCPRKCTTTWRNQESPYGLLETPTWHLDSPTEPLRPSQSPPESPNWQLEPHDRPIESHQWPLKPPWSSLEPQQWQIDPPTGPLDPPQHQPMLMDQQHTQSLAGLFRKKTFSCPVLMTCINNRLHIYQLTSDVCTLYFCLWLYELRDPAWQAIKTREKKNLNLTWTITSKHRQYSVKI